MGHELNVLNADRLRISYHISLECGMTKHDFIIVYKSNILMLLIVLLGCVSLVRFSLGAVGAAILLCSLVVLACLNQDEARHSFGHTGGMLKFLCNKHG